MNFQLTVTDETEEIDRDDRYFEKSILAVFDGFNHLSVVLVITCHSFFSRQFLSFLQIFCRFAQSLIVFGRLMACFGHLLVIFWSISDRSWAFLIDFCLFSVIFAKFVAATQKNRYFKVHMLFFHNIRWGQQNLPATQRRPLLGGPRQWGFYCMYSNNV